MTSTAAVEHSHVSPSDTDEGKLERVGDIISSSMKWAAAAGAVPVPLLDTIALAAVQTKMLMDLSEVYDQKFGKEAAQAIVSVMLGALIPTAATGMFLGSAIKAAPIIGTVAGMASMAALGAGATYAVGKVFARHLIGGGKVSEFNAEAIKSDLKAEFNNAKSKVG